MPDAIDNYIAPSNLIGLVQNTAPFLFPLCPDHPAPGRLIEGGGHPKGFLQILRGVGNFESGELTGEALLEDYFAFCVACHHTTVATYVPTDVDSKIRGLLWRQNRNVDSLRRMFEFTVRSLAWDEEAISRKGTRLTGAVPVSGHNGEQLSVLAGALGQFLKRGDAEYAGRAAEVIHGELEREAAEFQFALSHKGRELDVLRLASTLTHNVGDLNQGISFWPTVPTHDEARAQFHRLAHENATPYGGMYQIAARIYKKAMSTEGHRNYPLRGVKALRRSADLLMPQLPFLDEWGALIASHPGLDWQERAEVLAALVHGCRTIPNQRGYFRAIHGMVNALGGGLERVLRLLPARTRAEWKDAELRKQIAVPRVSFESMMKKMIH